jgi:hypothetical protein
MGVGKVESLVDGPVGESLRRRERLAFEDGNQRSVGADQAGQPLGAATPWIDSQEHFGVADEEVSVSHDTQIARPGQLRAQAERRTVKGGNEDGAAGVHPQQRRVQAVELDGTSQRGPAHHGLQDTGAVRDSGQACYRCGAASAQRRDRSTPFLQPPDVSMADEPLRMRPGEDDGTDAWFAVDPVHQLL